MAAAVVLAIAACSPSNPPPVRPAEEPAPGIPGREEAPDPGIPGRNDRPPVRDEAPAPGIPGGEDRLRRIKENPECAAPNPPPWCEITPEE